jgi:chemotaxis protein MotB
MVTFSDLSTLLLTFFVLLLAMSSMDDRKLKSAMTNFTSSCGILFFKEYGEVYQPKEVLVEGLYETLKETLVIRRSDDPPEELVAQSTEKFIEEIGSALVIEHFKGGFKLIFGHELLFPPGSADINETMEPVLKKVARFIRFSNYQVYIDGHTDSIPPSGRKGFDSNEDLSLARAYNLMQYLLTEEQVPNVSIALGGYGPFHPTSSNDTPVGRAKNRRVEIIFKNQKYF